MMYEAPNIKKGANGASKVAIPVSLMWVNLEIDTNSSTVFYFFIGALTKLVEVTKTIQGAQSNFKGSKFTG